ncbi:hypothetical protein H2199_003190 [Coniosporium tulheliwenetii]|uniref:Uncharacterized protein n=1 Tax=Coniosporium tulheliwenetii TaxID=3383036 RepID=A0ACC2ZCL5_9PEZI|nr:hypothetical protein H2199_003190 [Cladosporium sp. JES 115]
MAVFSSMTIVRALSIFHLTVAFFLLTSPRTISEQNLVYLLGESMRLVHNPLPLPSPPLPSSTLPLHQVPLTAFLAVLFAFLGLSDFTAASMPSELSIPFFTSQAPVRLLFLFMVTSYTYLFKRGGMFAGQGLAYKPGVGEELKNGVVFTWGFLELTAWFWVFLTLRDERRQAAIQLMERRKAEADRM